MRVVRGVLGTQWLPRRLALGYNLLAGTWMTGRRHLGRTSAEFLSADGSLFDAIQNIIGQKLRERYALPREVPQDISRLLTQLDEPQTEIQEVDKVSASEMSPDDRQ